MTPPTEALTALPDGAPSLVWATIRMVLVLAGMGAAAWFFLRWHKKSRGPARHMEILERTFFNRNNSVALLRVDGRRLLLGISPEGIRLLRDMDSAASGSDRKKFDRILREASEEKEAAS
jgi:flagellar biosynthetic protein FliO